MCSDVALDLILMFSFFSRIRIHHAQAIDMRAKPADAPKPIPYRGSSYLGQICGSQHVCSPDTQGMTRVGSVDISYLAADIRHGEHDLHRSAEVREQLRLRLTAFFSLV